jgi:hypothetical protein
MSGNPTQPAVAVDQESGQTERHDGRRFSPGGVLNLCSERETLKSVRVSSVRSGGTNPGRRIESGDGGVDLGDPRMGEAPGLVYADTFVEIR